LSTSWLVHFQNRVYFGYAGSDDSYPTNLLVINLADNRVHYRTYGREIRSVAVDNTNNALIAGDTSGYVWNLEDSDATTDDDTAVSWEIESKAFALQTRRHFPRWVKYDVDASNATTATGAVIVDGSTLQSHTLSGDRDTRRRLVATGNGRRCSIKISGTGPVEIYATEAE
jgi:hypothetical protein